MPGSGGPSSGNRRVGPVARGHRPAVLLERDGVDLVDLQPVSTGANDTPSAASAIP